MNASHDKLITYCRQELGYYFQHLNIIIYKNRIIITFLDFKLELAQLLLTLMVKKIWQTYLGYIRITKYMREARR